MKKIKPPILRPNEEEEILQCFLDKAKKGEPVLRQDVTNKVVEFLKSDQRKNPFRNGVPGDKWFSLFRRRHNSHFVTLEPSMLKALEQVGFTEKVTNTVTYPRPALPSTPSIHVRKLVKKPTPARDSVSPMPAVVLSSPHSDESSHTIATDDGDSKSQGSSSDSTDFRPGSKLEVMDFNEKWYPVKVVEVDYEEGEVLVHFEKWSDRYDEWMRMDSNRIRRPTLTSTSMSKKSFEVNEKVIAVWTYNHKYPATVRKVLPNDKYEVLFVDGYAKILRGCKLFKATEEDLKNVQLPPPKKPAPPMGADPLDPDLGPKEERRLKKRRLDVLESYKPHKRQRLDPPQSTPETSPQQPASYPSKAKPKLRISFRMPRKQDDEPDDEEEEDDTWQSEKEEDQQEVKASETKVVKRRKRRKKKVFDESTYTYRALKHRAGMDEDSERWNTEIPEGVSPVQIKDHKGYYRESIIIPDKKIPKGWTKHTMRRRSGAKWDVFLVNPAGRKFRSRNELRNYFAENDKPFPEDCFDFMVGRKMEMIRSQVETRKKMHSGILLGKKFPHKGPTPHKEYSSHKKSLFHQKSDGEGHPESKKSATESTPDFRRVKTMLPKGRHLDSGEDVKQEYSPGPPPVTPALTSPPFPLTELRTPDGGFTCCGKNFRKENLFQMHMKHYHPEYSNLFGSTPNVADLAYARTVGEPLEDSRAEAMTPKNSFIERVSKYEAERKSLTLTDSVSPSLDSLRKKGFHEKETTPISQIKEEESTTSSIEKTTDPAIPSEKIKVEDRLESEEGKEADKTLSEVSEGNVADLPKNIEAPLVPPEEIKSDTTVEVKKEAAPETVVEHTPTHPPSSSFLPDSASPSVPTVTPSTPIIRPVSKAGAGSTKALSSEAVVVQTTSSPRTPVTITKYIPPGQKPASSVTKMTISMTTTPDKEVKPTIKTLMPMRPPLHEASVVHDVQKTKDVKPKEEAEEEGPHKSRPRKRTMSDSFPKKPKLAKPTTGSLEEDSAEVLEPPASPVVNTSYRFSRNRSLPRVSLEKLNVTTDNNGRVVLPSPEDKITNTAGRRAFKSFKAANKIRVETSIVNTSEEPVHAPAEDTVYENLRKEEIINCTCGYMEEDGLMIQCDLCLCWQHGLCNNIDKEADVPEKYVCYICQNPARQRTSSRYTHNQDWLKEGKVPSLTFRPKNEEAITQRETMLKKSHDLTSSLLQLKTAIRSLRVKTNIATKPDHPKLYLWAKSWKNGSSDKEIKSAGEGEGSGQEVSGPQPEAAIDETECRLRLLEHVEDYQHQVDDRLTSLQAQIAALESEDPDLASDEVSDHYPVTKQTVQMILHDLNTARRVAALN